MLNCKQIKNGLLQEAKMQISFLWQDKIKKKREIKYSNQLVIKMLPQMLLNSVNNHGEVIILP